MDVEERRTRERRSACRERAVTGAPRRPRRADLSLDRHPAIRSATRIVEDEAHPSTAHLGPTWTRTDEGYDYRSNPRARVNVLPRLDEGS